MTTTTHIHGNTGKSHSNGTKAVMSEKKTGPAHPKFKGWYVTPAGVFANLRSAAAANTISSMTVSARCKNLLFGASGWAFREKSGYSSENTPEYRRYLDNKRNGDLDGGKKEAHYDIYKLIQQGFRKKHHGGNVTKMDAPAFVTGVTPLKNYPSVSFCRRAETSVYGESSFLATGATQNNVGGVTEIGVTTNLLGVTGDVNTSPDIKNIIEESDREVPTYFSAPEIPQEKAPRSTPAPAFKLFSRAAILPTLNEDYKRVGSVCLYDSNEAKITFKCASLLIVQPTNK